MLLSVSGCNAAPFDSLKPYELGLFLSSDLHPSWLLHSLMEVQSAFCSTNYSSLTSLEYMSFSFQLLLLAYWRTHRFMLTLGSFAGLGFLSWYLAGKIKVFDRKGHVAKLCIVLSPLLLAALVAVSRVDDYWHHWQDVGTGGLLGRSWVVPPPFYSTFTTNKWKC